MASPVKKRKKNLPNTQPTRTLHYFFNKQTATKKETLDSVPVPEPQPDPAALTDEQYAKTLAEEWKEEDKARRDAIPSMNGESSRTGEKRRRSSSPNTGEVTSSPLELSREGEQKDNLGWAAPQTSRAVTSEQIPNASGIPQTPKKIAVSAEAALEIERAIGSMPFDEDPLKFDPDNYQSIVQKWPGGKATYALLTHAFVLVNSTRSRIKIVDTLVNFLRVMIRLDPKSLLPAVWLTTNDIGPSYETNEFGIGGSIISKAIMKTSGITPATLKKLNNKYGDPGDVAFEAKVKQRTLMMKKPTPLTIENVYTTLVKISRTSGKGSQEIKQRHVERLLIDAKGEEIRYLTRTLIHHLRIGAVKTTMLIALSRAFSLSAPEGANWSTPEIPDSKEERQELFSKAEEVLKQCHARRPNYNDIVPCLLRGGITSLEENCGMSIHIPLKPMLGSITRDLREMLLKLQGREFGCEYKYDGQRAQIHCDDTGKVSVFSRHLELMTSKYPDLVELVPQIRCEGVKSFMMEGEVVAMDTETGLAKNFQTLAGRERKNVDVGRISVDVCLFAFDLMYLNGQELLSRPFRERRELLRSMFTEIPHRFTWVKSIDATSEDVDTIQDFFHSSLDLKCEGIMVKVLDNSLNPPASVLPEDEEESESKQPRSKKGKEIAPIKKGSRGKPLLATYEPDKRLESWLKVKKDYTVTADTLDLVPIAAWHGNGRKSAWWSPILLALHNPETGAFEAVCKCMSGFTDKYYIEMKDTFAPGGINTSTTKKAYYEVTDSLRPAIWFEPREVWEVAFADITVSPTYTAAAQFLDGGEGKGKGLSLRFPRFVRKREDKGIEEASIPEFLADLFFKQERGGKKLDKGAMDEKTARAEEEAEVDDVDWNEDIDDKNAGSDTNA
ncbi:ATP-dependent DNA ligase [Choiromyces venosus 120613-1]|uniref:DNA ligase n=1 Tax=Choiromyces venosus 120613-1 TaxID=1336337 RepID=A0A3N4J1G8_9PEZI|nr:ATP-dependent DNA ligase [Choiromyces venosus 120613-1]